MTENERVYSKVSPSAFRALLAQFKEVRFLITPDNHFHVANANTYTHMRIGNQAGYRIYDENAGMTICGYAAYNNDNPEYFIAYTCGDEEGRADRSKRDDIDHMQLQRLEARGFSRVFHPFDFVW